MEKRLLRSPESHSESSHSRLLHSRSSEYNEEKSQFENVEDREFVWYYGDGWTADEHSDVCHFSEIGYEQAYDSTTTLYIQSAMSDGTVNPSVNWKADVEAPTSASTSSASASTASSSPEKFSKETWRKFGLQKVPLRELKKRGIPVNNVRVVDGDKVWFATKPKVSFTRVSASESPI